MGYFRLVACCAAAVLCVQASVAFAADPPPGRENSPARADSDWPNYGNDKGGMRYSRLDQVNRENVSGLKVAWTYRVDDADPSKNTTIECTPLVVDGVMYVTTVTTKVVALDAATGKELWKFDPYGEPYGGPGKKWIKASGGVNRGVAFWSNGKPVDNGGRRRVIVGLSDGRLVSLDAATGKPDAKFGKDGVLDLRAGIETDISKRAYGPTSPPAVFEDIIIVGCSNDEGHPGAPGDPRAFSAETGEELWRFHSIPRPGEEGSETWEQPDAWKDRGGANPWGGFTVDAENGIAFMGTGSAGPDFYGAGRKGANLFADCVLALDARTGKRLWHFQTVHHDLWDHDNPCPPVVVKVKQDGKEIEAVAQVTKTAFCYLLDRKTGKPLFGVKEVPVPASEVPGEQAHPTQPMPLKPPPLSRLKFTEEDVTDISPEAREFVLKKLKDIRHGEWNLPLAEKPTVVTPGFHGGATWAGASFDPTTGLLYVNTNNAPYLSSLKKRADGSYEMAGYGYFTDDKGYSAMKPPWGQLTAIDLNTGDFAWRVTLGEFPELKAKGVPQTGTENFGGTIVTAGGLVFIGGTKDEKFHAFDKSTGKLLWDHQLPAGGYATPCTYLAKGKQYVCIAAGGGGKPRTKSGDSFIAFALPDGEEKPAAKNGDKPEGEANPPAAPKAAKEPGAWDPTDAYESRKLEGWTVRVHKRLIAEQPDRCDKTLELLRHQLFQITRVVPAGALEKLRTIPIWVELHHPRHPCMCYHVSPGWLRENGMNPDKAGGVEIANPKNFLTWTRDQPWMVLHELAHGYHDKFLDRGYANADVRDALRKAVEEKRYDSVLHINGRTQKAYAKTNPQEYFAECSEAYFGTNDFFPFVRAELKKHDPEGYELMRKTWGD